MYFVYTLYLCNQCLSPLSFWGRIPLRRGVLDTTFCNKVCQWIVTGWWFFPATSTPVSSTNKTDRHNLAEKLLKVALNTITLTLFLISLHILMFKILENSCDIVVSFREESVLNKTGKIQSLSQWAIVYPP